ncbi:ead/Ea22-like family protein [Klebsiella variicola]|uniref:ead/Ea22-like family protein n=1 Tax=Klebsiella variicola TaxID=244366 RepID=UPI00254B99DC|nr:ead/Ea22-like family protein [Klebsiella variicola]MEC5701587.1 ead/Ea22-like family protein [Klebsiella variicola]
MTDITELAQRNELLIANGQQTADLLRHLADNEIDSDYFAVVSECESYGKETDAELSITEFALRAAGYVDALVEALEKAQAAERRWHRVASRIHEQACESDVKIDELEAIRAAAEKLVRCKGRYHSEQNYRSLAALFGVTTPDLPPLEHENVHYADAAEMEIAALRQRIAELESRTVTVKMPKPHAHLIWIQAGHAPDDYWDDVAVSHSEKDRCCDGSERYPVYARWEIEEMLAAAGIKVEAE